MRIDPKKEKILDDGWYDATIGETEQRETKFGERLLVPFEVYDDGDVVPIDAWVSLSDHPKSNLVKWGKELFGPGPFDTDDLNDKEVQVSLEVGEDNDGAPKNFVRKIRPRKKEAAKKKSA